MKQPSADTNPASQWGLILSDNFTVGLGTGITPGKLHFNSSDKPLFIDALILKISWKPFGTRCSFLFINSKADLNNKKSACF